MRVPGPALALVALLACAAPPDPEPETGRAGTHQVAQNPAEVEEQRLAHETRTERRVLLDGDDLSAWRTGVFGDPPDYEVTEDGVVLPQMDSLSGMTFTGEPPRTPYTLVVEATKLYGPDFFLGVTFPVRDAHLTLVLGGWGGMVTGLSCIDGLDASDNDTKTSFDYPNGKRQRVVIDVEDTRVVATVNGVRVVDRILDADEELGLRTEVRASRPLGLAAFATSTCVHRVELLEGRGPDPARGVSSARGHAPDTARPVRAPD